MISSMTFKGLLFAFVVTLVSIPPTVSVVEKRYENIELSKQFDIEKIEFEQNIIRLNNACK